MKIKPLHTIQTAEQSPLSETNKYSQEKMHYMLIIFLQFTGKTE